MSVGDDVLITGPTGAEMLLPEDQTGIGGPLRLDTLALALVVFKFFCLEVLAFLNGIYSQIPSAASVGNPNASPGNRHNFEKVRPIIGSGQTCCSCFWVELQDPEANIIMLATGQTKKNETLENWCQIGQKDYPSCLPHSVGGNPAGAGL